MQVQRNSFQWFHEEDLPLDSITVVPPVRLQFLADLKGSVGNLGAMLESVTEMQRRYQGPFTCDFSINFRFFDPQCHIVTSVCSLDNLPHEPQSLVRASHVNVSRS